MSNQFLAERFSDMMFATNDLMDLRMEGIRKYRRRMKQLISVPDAFIALFTDNSVILSIDGNFTAAQNIEDENAPVFLEKCLDAAQLEYPNLISDLAEDINKVVTNSERDEIEVSSGTLAGRIVRFLQLYAGYEAY